MRLKECPGCRMVKRFGSGNIHCADCVNRPSVAPVWACGNCGSHLDTNRKYCDLGCQPSQPDMRSSLRIAIESEDWPGVIECIRMDSRTVDGCWEWQRAIDRTGYPRVKVGKRYLSVHRLSLSAKCGASLGSQAAHHICANTKCVNPQHLVPVTHVENIVEMMARSAYLSRIAELEEALIKVDPLNAALMVLPLR